jgi:hypothetical protein
MIWVLLVTFKLKHFIADYLLQGKYMLGKFKEKGWVLPLSAHCGVHTLFTLSISLFVVNYKMALALGVLDFVIHFIMDRVKASPKLLGRFKALSAKEYKDFQGLLNNSPDLNKSHPKEMEDVKLRWKVLQRSNTYFWWSLGFDQLIHGLTDLLIVLILMTFGGH